MVQLSPGTEEAIQELNKALLTPTRAALLSKTNSEVLSPAKQQLDQKRSAWAQAVKSERNEPFMRQAPAKGSLEV